MILYINSHQSGNTWDKGQYLLAAAKRLGLDYVLPYKGEGEFVLNVEPYDIAVGSRWTGLWEIDLLLDRVEYTDNNWFLANDIFIAINRWPHRLEKYSDKFHYLPQACDPYLHKPLNITKEYDFVLAGTINDDMHMERKKLISFLDTMGFTNIYYGKDFPPQRYNELYNTARVQFIRSMDGGEVAQRFFECLAIGPTITDYNSDLELLGLIEGKDYFSYKNEEELLNKFKTLIDNPDKAQQMAESGRKKALLLHTYEHRLISIINIIKERYGFHYGYEPQQPRTT